MNHEHYQQRLDSVQSVLQLNNLEAKSIEAVEYDINGPFPYNNFIYLVTLFSPTTTAIRIGSSQSDAVQPGTLPFPAKATSLIVRLANSHPGTGLNNTNRVENEIACMSLARQALANSKYSHVVPEVYAWANVSSGQEFSIQQYMLGTMPDRVFDDLTLQDKSVVLEQIADILALFQQFKIPTTVNEFGGLKFDEDGTIISAQMTIFKAGPCAIYTDFIRSQFIIKLQEADENPLIQGWRDNGVRTRLERFLGDQLEEILREYEDVPKALFHADLSINNILFDAATLQVTAVLDYDFSYIGTVADEFMAYSFGNIPGGKLPGPYEGASWLNLRREMLTGFSEHVPSTDVSELQWDVARLWDEVLARAGAAKPNTISRFKEISDIYWLQDKVNPFELDSPVMRKRKTAEQLKATRDETESLIVQFLESKSTSSSGGLSQ